MRARKRVMAKGNILANFPHSVKYSPSFQQLNSGDRRKPPEIHTKGKVLSFLLPHTSLYLQLKSEAWNFGDSLDNNHNLNRKIIGTPSTPVSLDLISESKYSCGLSETHLKNNCTQEIGQSVQDSSGGYNLLLNTVLSYSPLSRINAHSYQNRRSI